MKKKTDKQILFERMNKIAGMPLNENYPPGADEDPNAPWNEPDEDEEINEPDPDEYRDDDMSENHNVEKMAIIFELIDKNTNDVIKKQGAIIQNDEEFINKMKKFKESFDFEYDKNDQSYYIRLRVPKDKYGTLTKEQENAIEHYAWDALDGDHYELKY